MVVYESCSCRGGCCCLFFFFFPLRLSACHLMMAMPGERTGDLLFFFRPEEGTGLDF